MLIMVSVLACSDAAAGESISEPALRQELLDLARADQAVRASRPVDLRALRKVDTENTERLKSVVERYGWPGASTVGADGAQAAWLLVQHASGDPGFQRMALSMIEPLVERGEISVKLYAYLYDRTHSPQRYGTQGACTAPGVWSPREIEDPVNVDERRALAKIEPVKLADYVALASEKSCGK